MKKTLLSACAILVALATFAQQANVAELPNESLTKGYSTMSITPNFTPSIAAVVDNIIWQDSCSDASNWIFTNTSTLNIGWGIETDPAAVAVSTGSDFASATVSDGFLFVNSESLSNKFEDVYRVMRAPAKLKDPKFKYISNISLTGLNCFDQAQ